MSVKLVEITRSGVVESIHRGDVAVVDAKGRIVFQAGDPEKLTFFRSSAKPIIAVASLESGIAEKFEFGLKEIALMASSHSGEKEHIQVLKTMLKKIGIEGSNLKCGIKEPTGEEAARELIAEGGSPTELHCNCSGKHIGVIASVLEKGLPWEDYHKTDHLIQRDIQKVISDFSGVEAEGIIKGIDGCGITVYAIPLKNMAFAYANLCNQEFMQGKYKKSQNYVLSAMTMYPEMVAGKGRLDTVLMSKFGSRVVGKFGAEGVYCCGILGRNMGIAVKIEDGNSRAVAPVILELLVRLGVVSASEMEELEEYWRPAVLNHRGEAVGEYRIAGESGIKAIIAN